MKSAGIEKQQELIVQVKRLSEQANREGEEFLHKVLLAVLDFYGKNNKNNPNHETY